MKINMVVLGRAAPELYKQKQSVTVIGYSNRHGFIRVPVRVDAPLKQWSICTIEALKKKNDSRKESYLLKGDWEQLNSSITVHGEMQREERLGLVRKLSRNGIESLRDGSIAVIKPINPTVSIEQSGSRKIQKTLAGRDIVNKADYEAKVIIEYFCSPSCEKRHRHWVIEWGVYEALRKSNDPAKMIEGLHIGDKSYEKYLLIGTRGRSRFVIVSVLRFREFEREPDS
jgi:hypothetical protein